MMHRGAKAPRCYFSSPPGSLTILRALAPFFSDREYTPRPIRR